MMPPQFGPGPTPEVLEQMRAIQRAEEAAMIAQREDMMRFPMIFCDCSARWLISPLSPERDPAPPQAECMIHGRVMVTRDGRVM